ncbi:MAG TPA: hypothetical protein VNO53_04380 [Steroidobacteraceae bacterium]|nr:hypothetical protein [Steroidobacteraceae bacterium]
MVPRNPIRAALMRHASSTTRASGVRGAAFVVSALLAPTSAGADRDCAPRWQLVYRHDADGRPVTGARSALHAAIRRGQPLRAAWGFSTRRGDRDLTVEHAAEPLFVTIVDAEHVFVQLPEHIGQRSYVDAAGARFDRPAVMWRGLLGTDGTFDAVYVNRATGEEVRRVAQRAAVAWFAERPPAGCEDAPAVDLAIPGGVRRD